MALYLIDQQQQYQLGVWKIEESEQQLSLGIDDTPHIAAAIKGYSHQSRRIEKLATYRLLEQMIGYSVEIMHHENGAPYLSDSSHYISISHTKGYIAILLHANRAVGVDIEYMNDRIQRIKERFLHPEELHHIDPQHSSCHLLLYWSMKETLFKALLEHDIDFSDELRIAPFHIADRGATTGSLLRYTAPIDLTLHWILESGFVLTYTLGSSL